MGTPGLIAAFIKEFESSGALVAPPEKWEEELGVLAFALRDFTRAKVRPPFVIRWSEIYFLTKTNGFLTFGETDEGFIFFTDKTAGFLPGTGYPPRKTPELGGAANGSQPIRPETNSASSAAGSRR